MTSKIGAQKIMTMMMLLSCSTNMQAISTAMNHRLVTSSPLLYKQINYSEKEMSFELEPFISGMFDPEHTMANLGINGQSSMTLNNFFKQYTFN